MTQPHVIRRPRGSITVTPEAVAQIVRRAVGLVDGVRVRRRGLDVDVADGHARVELELAVPVGLVLPDAARAVQRNVAEALRQMCALEVESVNVAVEEIA